MIQRVHSAETREGDDLLVAGLLPEMLYPIIGVGLDARAAQEHRRGINQNSHDWSTGIYRRSRALCAARALEPASRFEEVTGLQSKGSNAGGGSKVRLNLCLR